jgi:hypothetical protein
VELYNGGGMDVMQWRSRKSHFLSPQKPPTKDFLQASPQTWALVLALMVTMILSALALGALWDSLKD